MAKIRVGVIYGGKSGEHEVSVMSAESVMAVMDRERYEIVRIFIDKRGRWYCEGRELSPWELPSIIDFALPILHGPNGEDGSVQGLLQLAGIPYGGCTLLGCATSMDKITARKLFAAEGLPQTPYIALSYREIGEESVRRICESLDFPIFVKPSNMGSSVGISKVTHPRGLLPALKLAATFDGRILAEQGVNARELEISVMGNHELSFGAAGEIVPAGDFYDYEAKYFDRRSRLLVPAPISPVQEQALKDMAAKGYKALACSGYARVDFLMDKETEKIYINEINAIPGFTEISMFPRLMMAAGMEYPQIIDRIVELGYERYNAENNR